MWVDEVGKFANILVLDLLYVLRDEIEQLPVHVILDEEALEIIECLGSEFEAHFVKKAQDLLIGFLSHVSWAL